MKFSALVAGRILWSFCHYLNKIGIILSLRMSFVSSNQNCRTRNNIRAILHSLSRHVLMFCLNNSKFKPLPDFFMYFVIISIYYSNISLAPDYCKEPTINLKYNYIFLHLSTWTCISKNPLPRLAYQWVGCYL